MRPSVFCFVPASRYPIVHSSQLFLHFFSLLPRPVRAIRVTSGGLEPTLHFLSFSEIPLATRWRECWRVGWRVVTGHRRKYSPWQFCLSCSKKKKEAFRFLLVSLRGKDFGLLSVLIPSCFLAQIDRYTSKDLFCE